MLAWGMKVSWQFRMRVAKIGINLRMDPSFLMACMAFETGKYDAGRRMHQRACAGRCVPRDRGARVRGRRGSPRVLIGAVRVTMRRSSTCLTRWPGANG